MQLRRRPFIATLALAGAVLVVAGASAATPVVTGFVSGQVTSVKGAQFVVKDSFGAVAESTVSLANSGTVTERLTADHSDLTVGACVMANGEKATTGGAIDAERLTITSPVDGKCATTGFFGHGGGRPGNGAGGPYAGGANGGRGSSFAGFGGGGNFGFAFGSLTAVNGNTLEVKGTPVGSTKPTTTKVELSSSTQLTAVKTVDASAITVGACASIRGTSTNEGLTVKATSVSISQPTSNGCGLASPAAPSPRRASSRTRGKASGRPQVIRDAVR